jgi:hypothetical protein
MEVDMPQMNVNIRMDESLKRGFSDGAASQSPSAPPWRFTFLQGNFKVKLPWRGCRAISKNLL